MPALELLKFVKTVCRQKVKGQSVEVKSAHVDGPRQLYDTLSSFSSQDKGLSTGVRRQAVHKKFDMENGHGALVRMLLHLMPALSITHRDGTDSKEPPRLN